MQIVWCIFGIQHHEEFCIRYVLHESLEGFGDLWSYLCPLSIFPQHSYLVHMLITIGCVLLSINILFLFAYVLEWKPGV